MSMLIFQYVVDFPDDIRINTSAASSLVFVMLTSLLTMSCHSISVVASVMHVLDLKCDN